MPKPRPIVPSLMLVLSLAACGSGAAAGAADAPLDGPGPQLAVERFLAAANANDWQLMGQLFGTPDETIAERDGPTRSERHMQLLASLLRHEDYTVRGRQQVPGRRDATNVLVEIVRQGTDRGVTVPFLVVRRENGGWIIQQIHRLEELT